MFSMTYARLAVLAVGCLPLAETSALASCGGPLTVDSVFADSEMVFRGDVLRVDQASGEDPGDGPSRLMTVEVVEAFKGTEAGQKLALRVQGLPIYSGGSQWVFYASNGGVGGCGRSARANDDAGRRELEWLRRWAADALGRDGAVQTHRIAGSGDVQPQGSAEAVGRSIQEHEERLLYCYRRRQRSVPALEGQYQATFSIESGQTTAVKVTGPDVDLRQCLAKKVERWIFATQEASVSWEWTLSLAWE